MLVKSQVKYIQNLGHKKFRDADGVFVAEGPKIVNELLQSERVQLVKCFFTETWSLPEGRELDGKDGRFFQIDDKELERISFQNSPNQVLAIFTKPLFEENIYSGGLTLLLDTIQDPGNLGTIIRTADWFGLKRIVCSTETADVFNQKVVQSAMGSIIRVEMMYTDLVEYIGLHPGIPLYASSLHGKDLQNKIQFKEAFLLLGNESKGIRPELEILAGERIRIPRKGGAESLNVAVATGVLLSCMEPVS